MAKDADMSNDLQWCVADFDESIKNTRKDEDCMFVNLSENREQYTAYKGAPVWEAIYEENCFNS